MDRNQSEQGREDLNNTKQRILITGGSGLLAVNWALVVRERASLTLGLHQRNVLVRGVQTRQIDLESLDNLLRSFEEIAPHVVIHTAGLTSVERCESEPSFAHHVNVTLAANVAKACGIAGVRLVHISTDHLFSGRDSMVDENHPISPINVYGKTKAEAEYRVLDASSQALVIRTNFYGWGTSYRDSFSDVVIGSLRAGVGSKLTLYKDVFYTPILAETAILAIHELLDLNAFGIYHVVGDDRLSKYDFGLRIADKFKLDFNRINCGFMSNLVSPVRRPHDMSLANRKVCKLIGRELGGVNQHITRLQEQEQNGIAREMRTT